MIDGGFGFGEGAAVENRVVQEGWLRGEVGMTVILMMVNVTTSLFEGTQAKVNTAFVAAGVVRVSVYDGSAQLGLSVLYSIWRESIPPGAKA